MSEFKSAVKVVVRGIVIATSCKRDTYILVKVHVAIRGILVKVAIRGILVKVAVRGILVKVVVGGIVIATRWGNTFKMEATSARLLRVLLG